MGSLALEVKNLSTSFDTRAGRVPVLHDVSFNLESGKSLAIVGESGAGKSVLMRSVLGVHPRGSHPDVTGSVLIDGEDAAALSPTERRSQLGQKIGFIHQDPLLSLNPTQRIVDQLTEPLKIHRPKVSKKERYTQAVSMLTQIGFREPEVELRKFPHELSGGQRQRIGIGAAMILNPSLVVADEPTTALDVTVQKQVLDLLDDMRARYNSALLLVTHDLAVAAERCDEIAVLYRGRIIERGPAYDVVTNPREAYTESLLAATLTLDGPRQERIITVEGSHQ